MLTWGNHIRKLMIRLVAPVNTVDFAEVGPFTVGRTWDLTVVFDTMLRNVLDFKYLSFRCILQNFFALSYWNAMRTKLDLPERPRNLSFLFFLNILNNDEDTFTTPKTPFSFDETVTGPATPLCLSAIISRQRKSSARFPKSRLLIPP